MTKVHQIDDRVVRQHPLVFETFECMCCHGTFARHVGRERPARTCGGDTCRSKYKKIHNKEYYIKKQLYNKQYYLKKKMIQNE